MRKLGSQIKAMTQIYGARPLKRVIQREVQDPLSELILAGDVSDGDLVEVSTNEEGLSFNGVKSSFIGSSEPPSEQRTVH